MYLGCSMILYDCTLTLRTVICGFIYCLLCGLFYNCIFGGFTTLSPCFSRTTSLWMILGAPHHLIGEQHVLLFLNNVCNLTNGTNGRLRSMHLSVGIVKSNGFRMVFLDKRYVFALIANNYFVLLTPFIAEQDVKLICKVKDRTGYLCTKPLTIESKGSYSYKGRLSPITIGNWCHHMRGNV